MDKVRWQVKDPLGNEILLSEENFIHHIIEQHDSKDANIRAKIEPQTKFALEHPRFIVRNVTHPGRVKYLSLTNIQEGTAIYIRTIAVVVDADNEVVTWFARRTINDVLTEGDVIYDERDNRLQI